MPELVPYNSGPVTVRSMPFWCVANQISDPFGEPVLPEISSVQTCQLICEAAADGLIERTGFHDDDLVPWNPDTPEDDLDVRSGTYAVLVEIKEMLANAGVKVNTATCNLHGKKVFRRGGLANPDPKIREMARLKALRLVRIGNFLDAEYFTYWVARDGFEVPVVVPWAKIYPWIAEGLNAVHAYIKNRGFTNYKGGTIEYKHNEPRGYHYIPTSGDASSFIDKYLDADFWGENPELLQHDAMALMSAVRTAGFLTALKRLFFLHFGNQTPGQFDNDYQPLVGPTGLKETAYVLWVLDKVDWKGPVEYDCHMLRADADPDDPIGCRKIFIQECSEGLAIALRLAGRIGKETVYPDRHARADLMATANMGVMAWNAVERLARKRPAVGD